MGAIRRMVLNPVASNMLMILVLGGGLVAAVTIPRELFPEFSTDLVTVTVPYPGASPADVEQSICLKIEDKLTGMEGVKEIRSEGRESLGIVQLELETGANVRKVLDDVKSKVDKIEFPEDAEDPTTVEMTLRQQVINLAVAGEADERTLKKLAEEIRDEINDLPEVSQVSVSGVRDFEITVEVSEEALRRHKLTLGRVAQAIRDSSFDLPAGDVKTRGGEMSIRVIGEKRTAEQYSKIVLLSRPNGTIVNLGDVAVVREGFEDVDVGGQFNGKPAAVVAVYKTANEDSLEIAEAVRKYVDRKRHELPEGITLEPWSDMSKLIRDRLDMLVRNGLQGLTLVFLILWFFLGARMSLWVALGIPVSLLGAILVLNLGGMSLNMMSMFALIMALGLIVDDAIIVGENVYAQVEGGQLPRLAAIDGTRSVLLPVVTAVATTWAAFVPLMLIPGVMGRFVQILPVTVILALAFSLLECVVILPSHLAHSLRAQRRHDEPAGTGGGSVGLYHRAAGNFSAIRRRLDAGIRWFINTPFTRLYRMATRHRYVTVASFVAVMVVTLGAWSGGHIPFVGFPKIDSDTLRAQITMPTGTTFQRTGQVARQVTMGALAINDDYTGADGGPIVERVYSLLGQHFDPTGGATGAHLCQVIVELSPVERRGQSIPGEQLIRQWRTNTGAIPEAVNLDFGAFRGGPGGMPLEIRLLAPSTESLKPAVEQLKAKLASFDGVIDIRDDSQPGKVEMKVRRLKPGAENLGITLRALASQLRNAFHGNESLKIQRGRDEVKVMVRYPDWQRKSLADVENMRVRPARGAEVPFAEVADVELTRGYTTLRRVGRSSVITVSADVEEEVANAEQILDRLSNPGGFFDELRASYPGLRIDLRGQRQQIFESLHALYVWFPMALLAIFTVLAALFRSYVQPIIIMVAIPFGLVGAVMGHWIVGFDVTLLSMFGMVALAGIVVNDSLVLIDRINHRVRAGGTIGESCEHGARTRFRPIILTTLTTVAGVTPLLFERSFQAQFLKPMAISIAFGLLFATMLTLLMVPSLYLIGNDLRRAARWLRTGQWVAPEAVVQRDEPLPETTEPAP